MIKGSKMTLEQRQRLSESLKGRVVWNKGKKGLQTAWNKGISPSEETIRKQRESVIKTWANNPSLKIRQSELTKRGMANPETKKKISEASKRFWKNPELVKKRDETMKKVYANPKFIKKMSETSKNLWANQDYRKTLSEAHKGQHSSPKTEFRKGLKPWNKGIPYIEVAGEKNYNWKGGITPINEKIRKSLLSKAWREAVFKRDNWTCCNCKKRGGELQAHHIKEFYKYPELRFAVENGLTLCKECHKKTENYGAKNKFK